MTDTCKSCGADIVWAVTRKGRRIPLDPEPVQGGNVRIEARPGRTMALAVVVNATETGTHRSHFASCPNAARHRKRERKGK